MPSNINPYNINGNYPIAGQDNDSQGFRDNFTNIRNNFVFAEQEIEELQNKVVLKQPLIGSTSVDNDFAGNPITNARLDQPREKFYTIDASSGSVQIDFNNGTIQLLEIGSTSPNNIITISGFVNFPSNVGTKVRLIVQLNQIATSDIQRLTLPGAVTFGKENIQGCRGNDIYYYSNYTNSNGVQYRVYEFVTAGTGNFYINELQKSTAYKMPMLITSATPPTTITVPPAVDTLVLLPDGSVASLITVALPDETLTPDGFRLTIVNATTFNLSQIGWNAGVGYTVSGARADFLAGSHITYILHKASVTTGTWIRVVG